MKIRQWIKKLAQQKKNNPKNFGFTLIEMMIVITIIAMIMGFVVTKAINRYGESQISATKIQIKQLGLVLDDFRRVCGYYPSTEQGLQALVTPPTVGRQCKNYDPDGFIKKVPVDAWGGEFQYVLNGNKYTIKSLGPNGQEGGEGQNKVITSDDD